jgi:hypothetical protein
MPAGRRLSPSGSRVTGWPSGTPATPPGLPPLLTAADGSAVFACEVYTYDRPIRYHLDCATVHEQADRSAPAT